jgi:NADH-quinone oxidoreductase subunit L
VIHALSGEQDLWKMGGLKHHLPKTAAAMRWGAYALAGIAPFAGFFSKDEILGAAFAHGWAGHASGYALFTIGLVTAALTAFYSARLITLCFDGESRLDPKLHPHEAPRPMAFALQVLKVLSLVGGAALGIELLEAVHVHWAPLHEWLEPSLATPATHAEMPGALIVFLPLLALMVALLLWRVGAAWYRGDFATPRRLELSAPRLARAIGARFWVDEIYDVLFVKPLRAIAELCLAFDQNVVDGLFRGISQLAALLGTLLRMLQTGVVHAYAFWLLAGAALFLWLAFR